MRTLTACLAAVGLLTLPAAADEAAHGRAIVGSIDAGRALVLYDVTPEVRDLVDGHVSSAEAATRLERDALRALAKVAPSLPEVKAFEVRLSYFRTTAADTGYGMPTFAGVEHFAILRMPAIDVKNDRDRWKEAVASGEPIPPSVTFSVTGILPDQKAL